MKKLKLINYWQGLGFALIMLVTLLSLIEIKSGPNPISGLDKVVHFFIYFSLSSYYVQMVELKKKQLFKIILAFILMGLLIEVFQHFVPWRSFELLDLLANSCGALMGTYLAKSYYPNILIKLEEKL